jgi:hypothetical protein
MVQNMAEVVHSCGCNQFSAMAIVAAGEHNVLMSGPPIRKKSVLAETFSSILYRGAA